METKMEKITNMKKRQFSHILRKYSNLMHPYRNRTKYLSLRRHCLLSIYTIKFLVELYVRAVTMETKMEKFHKYKKTTIQSYFEEVQPSNASIQEQDKIPTIKGTLSSFIIHNNIIGVIVSKGGIHGNKNGKFHNCQIANLVIF